MEFEPFRKMARLSREIVITEKIDGTNAQIYIVPAREVAMADDKLAVVCGDHAVEGAVTIFAGSRNRWITPADDNFGFARWVLEHGEELRKLGPGRHFGEWWGNGIQRGYGLKEKRFSLFNVNRWTYVKENEDDAREVLPACCHVVPTLYRGDFDTCNISHTLFKLGYGSQAAPGFLKPEGIVVWHVAGNVGFKKTFGDDGHKGA